MAEKLDLNDVGKSKEFMMSYVIKREALINLLKEKGIIFREMSWEEIKGLPVCGFRPVAEIPVSIIRTFQGRGIYHNEGMTNDKNGKNKNN